MFSLMVMQLGVADTRPWIPVFAGMTGSGLGVADETSIATAISLETMAIAVMTGNAWEMKEGD